MGPAGRRKRSEPLHRTILRDTIEGLYSRYARPYDWLSSVLYLGRYRLWQRAVFPFLRGERVLEVGMGTGSLQLDLIDEGYRTWGVDRSLQMLREAARKAARDGQRSLSICQARAQALPFPAACFDAVVSTFPSGYILEGETHSEISRVLRPGGRLVLVAASEMRLSERAKALAEGVTARLKSRSSSHDAAQPHARELLIYPYSQDPGAPGGWVGTIKARLEEAGFAVSMYIAPTGPGLALIMVGDKGA